MNTLELSLSSLVDRTLLELEAAPEKGKAVVLGTTIAAGENSLTLDDGSTVNPSDLIEFGEELVLVTAKTDDPTPVFTLSRGYYQTTATMHTVGQVGSVNPQWPRIRVAAAIKCCFSSLEALGLPLLRAELMFGAEIWNLRTRFAIEMPENTRDVYSVRGPDLQEVPAWEFVEDLPLTEYSTGKAIRLSRRSGLASEFMVTYRVPYRWSEHPVAPSPTSTITIPEGAEHLPSAYATAWLTSAREISRSEIDRAAEWNSSEPMRNGVSQGLVRARWQEFYRALDEARRLDPPIARRPYIRRPV